VGFDCGASSVVMVADLALSRASPLPQGLRCTFSIVVGWAGAIASRLTPTGVVRWHRSGIRQRICSVDLLMVLMLLPTCNACYTSAIDRPSGH
jgi:hypothetical protein